MKKQLSNSEIEKLNTEIKEKFNVQENVFGKKDKVILVEENEKKFIIQDEVLFFYHESALVPSLKLLMKKNLLKQIVVDMGAVKFMVSGADVMRPGIVHIAEDIKKDEFVVIADQTHKKPLCVAQALYSGEEIQTMNKGKVLKNIHYVGDWIWKLA